MSPIYTLVKIMIKKEMASHLQHFLVLAMLILLTIPSHAQQLSPDFYMLCPQALPVIKSVVQRAIFRERRMGASLLRLHFHDCFVNVSCIHIHASCIPYFVSLSKLDKTKLQYEALQIVQQ